MKHSITAMWTTAAAAVVVACARESRTPTSPLRTSSVSPNGPLSAEEEVFGKLDHVDLSQGVWIATISPSPPWPFSDNMVVADTSLQNNARTANWGWYGIGWGAPCDAGWSDTLEKHYPNVGQGHEAHCLDPGRYTVTITRNSVTVLSRVIDFQSYPITLSDGSRLWAINHYGAGEAGANRYFGTPDVIVDFDSVASDPPPGRSSWAAVLNVSIAQDTLAPWDSAVTGGTVHVPAGMWLRVSAAATSNQWRTYVARFYWNGLDDTGDATGYGNPYSSTWFARAKRLDNSGEDRTVVAVVQPAGGQAVADSLAIHVDAAMTAEVLAPSKVYRDSAATLSAALSSGASEYRWEFGDGTAGSWTSSTDTTHAWHSNGIYRVRLAIRNVSHAVSRDTSHQVEVVPPFDSVHIKGAFTSGGESNYVAPDQTCEWLIRPFGGVQPFNFAWFKKTGPKWTLVGTEQLLDLAVGTASFELRGNVTDALNTTQSQTVNVTVSYGGATCIQTQPAP